MEWKDVSLARRTTPVPEDIDTERLLLLTQGMEERRNHLSRAGHGPTGLLPSETIIKTGAPLWINK